MARTPSSSSSASLARIASSPGAASLARIVISLPPDRRQHGVLRLFDGRGSVMMSCICLGRSAGHHSNPARDPLKFRGDTPLGRYALTHIVHLARPVGGIGSIWCPLDPDDRHNTPARRAELAGRSGLGIHGGRGNEVLKPTHGCIRVRDRDMADIARLAGKSRFTVEIIEAV